jgi:hypothetical protein
MDDLDGYVSTKGSGVAAMLGVGLGTLVSAASAIVTVLGAMNIERGGGARDYLETMSTLVVVSLVATLIGGIAFLAWFHRSYKNLPALGAARSHSPGWAIGAWFVPCLNLWRPYGIAQEIWRGSCPMTGSDDFPKSSPLVLVWWLSFVGAGVLTNVGMRMASGIWLTRDDLATSLWFQFGGRTLYTLAGILLVVIIATVTRAQASRAAMSHAADVVGVRGF